MKKNGVPTTAAVLLATVALVIGACKGPVGPEGPAGKDGVNGSAGASGQDGNNGQNGSNGSGSGITINVTVDSPEGAVDIKAAVLAGIKAAEEDSQLNPANKTSPASAENKNIFKLEVKGNFSLSNDVDMYDLYDTIATAGYYIDLDLSGARGFAFKHLSDAASFSKAKIISVTLGPNVKKIGDTDDPSNKGAFSNFSGLKRITAPGVTGVGKYAFYRCTSLAEANFPAATSIGDNAFYSCTSLATVTLPAATSIGNSAFCICTSLATVTLPAATSIGDTAFFSCTSLATVTLPAATSIGNRAFYLCERLATVNLGSPSNLNAPTLGYSMFYGISNSQTVTVTVPAGATREPDAGGYPANGTYNEKDKTNVNQFTVNWANGFRGGGWTGSAFVSQFTQENLAYMKQNIILEIKNQ